MNKKIYSFKNDYSEGAHLNILKKLSESNFYQQEGYGEDNYSLEAKKKIQEQLGNTKCDIHFVSGGTQANLIIISSFLRPHESVISAATGHINVHEAGAIEATGHKVCTINTPDGKLTPELIEKVLDIHEDEHMVKPAMVYISNSTELGTYYTKNDLEEISLFCKKENLLLFLDGARLGAALDASGVSLEDISKLVDIFYIGGTKNGALLGEAIVISNDSLKEEFRFLMKQKGALLAKGRLLGIQFYELFSNNLFYELAYQANSMAKLLSKGIKDLGYGFLAKPQTNLIFPIFPNNIIEKLNDKYDFYVIEKIDKSNSAVRLVTSWATEKETIEAFIANLNELTS
ncbi:MAG: threonine aldolase family protein [Clostridia bacterium]